MSNNTTPPDSGETDRQQEPEAHNIEHCIDRCPLHIGQCEHVCMCAAYIAAGL